MKVTSFVETICNQAHLIMPFPTIFQLSAVNPIRFGLTILV